MPDGVDLRPGRSKFRYERVDFRFKRADFSPERVDLRSQMTDFRGEWFKGGGENNRMVRWRTNESPPVFYRTSSLSGPLPCSQSTTSLDHSKQGIGYR